MHGTGAVAWLHPLTECHLLPAFCAMYTIASGSGSGGNCIRCVGGEHAEHGRIGGSEHGRLGVREHGRIGGSTDVSASGSTGASSGSTDQVDEDVSASRSVREHVSASGSQVDEDVWVPTVWVLVGTARTGGCRRRHIQVQVHNRNCMLLTTAGFEPKLLRCVGVSFLFLFQCLFLLCRSSSFLPS